jgi:hypothetical protein
VSCFSKRAYYSLRSLSQDHNLSKNEHPFTLNLFVTRLYEKLQHQENASILLVSNLVLSLEMTFMRGIGGSRKKRYSSGKNDVFLGYGVRSGV